MQVELTINDTYIPYIDNQSETQIYYGGAGSGKSRFVVGQRTVLDLIKGGRNYLACRKVQKSIRKSMFNEIEGVIDSAGLRSYFQTNKTEMSITCKLNDYQILFTGLDNPIQLQGVKPKRGVITDLLIDEATELEIDDLKILSKRLRGESDSGNIVKRKTLLFNPILQSHFIYNEFFKSVLWTDTQTEYTSPELSILKTWYIHNRFLTQQDIDALENEKDEYYYNVYTLGNWGALGDVIFRNFLIADLNDKKDPYYLPENQRTNLRRGGDFGFSKDPAAFGVSHYDKKRKTIYFFKELYEVGLTNDILAQRLKDMGEGTETSTWDSADPKSIQELVNHGINARGARKGKDSVLHGIQWLQQQKIVVHKDCVNMINELQQAHWKKDAGGNDFNPPRPSDKNNHLIDGSLRYAYENDMENSWWMSGVDNND